MSNKYTEAQLIELRSTAYVPTTVDFEIFAKSIQEQRELQNEQERRGSHVGIRPKFNKKPREKKLPPQADAEGWVTLDHKKKSESFSETDGLVERETFKEGLEQDTKKSGQTAARIKPNNKNISSSRPSDPRDITAEKPKSKFNAFAALDSEDEDSDDDE
ncbi:hypothetical protein WICMUC_001450 [Wickerhamomyces mucosus]|uniref:Cap-associated protein CAF20 n=1 Tax=Wickerhamomyces mucosus TaxID=1378264 RepID=A0A9P8PU32_9ASCO|nr:hypothetical protein WICMUC_001450 [Wickerhamomyces mucosus]